MGLGKAGFSFETIRVLGKQPLEYTTIHTIVTIDKKY